MRNEISISNKMDWATVAIYMVMLLFGWLNIFAAVYDADANNSLFAATLDFGVMPLQMKQFIFIVTSLIIILIILIVDMRFYETFAYVIFAGIMFLLLLVPLIGKEVAGNKSWLGVGAFGIQPSEFAKFATALAVAKFIGSVGFRMDQVRNQVVLFVIIGIPVMLILLQKDFGTAMVFAVFLLVFYREGQSPFFLLVGIGMAIIFILTLLVKNNWILFAIIGGIWLIVIYLNRKRKIKQLIIITLGAIVLIGTMQSVEIIFSKLPLHHQKRIMVMLNPDSDPTGYGWNVTQSKIAIGSGGFAGKGFLNGTQTKFDFVPEQSTDFIFCTIGEEHGWLGSLLVVGLFMGLLVRLLFIAERQKSRFARSYGYAVAAIFFFHFAVNIGMTLGLFPVIGIPLPFFSYGGSSLWAFTVLLFILLKLDAHRGQVLERL
ncbi:MAG TPA: rod shape-determining protein RodA [Cyclobacteriaceae bacterium]|nr:rod shape-determining protein RodA [Cyclobacteriaceae bacterium]HMV08038.1 rod shape-determining protein RodA [Cyclobacteriaceae bacterium]HMV88254.1 rod shape-determining protein RodA [Cyclobacteriaceae bacterium]HMX00678.1 rod shape-determining protein RodA [Cyclobacteriaceae bacterium]HMX49447.1 rod shape-determining protein RodA [Cyclobacteriaceae bacterium]